MNRWVKRVPFAWKKMKQKNAIGNFRFVTIDFTTSAFVTGLNVATGTVLSVVLVLNRRLKGLFFSVFAFLVFLYLCPGQRFVYLVLPIALAELTFSQVVVASASDNKGT